MSSPAVHYSVVRGTAAERSATPPPPDPPPPFVLRRGIFAPCEIPVACRAQIQDLMDAVRDTASYDALLIKHVSHEANAVLQRVMVAHAAMPVYFANLTDQDLRSSAVLVQRLSQALDQTLPKPIVLYLSHHARAISRHDEVELTLTLDKLSRLCPGVKVVTATQAPTLPAATSFPSTEVLDATCFAWDFSSEVRTQRAKDWLARNRLNMPLADALQMLDTVPDSLRDNMFRHATILAKRRHGRDESHPAQCSVTELHEAARILRARTLDPTDDEEGGTEFIEPFLVRGIESYGLQQNVAGVPDEVKRFVDIIKNYHDLKALVPSANKTMLLKGPPGTGKTTIARALSAETGYPLFAPKSSELVNKFIGVSAENVYKLFAQAQRYGEMHHMPVILFIDEIDAVVSRRSTGDVGAEREYARIVNAWLESLDGINARCDKVIVVGATNLDSSLDPAAVSRFSVKVEVPLPSPSVLKKIFQLHLKNRRHCVTDAELDALMPLAAGFSGRHAVNALDTAGYVAFEKQKGAEKIITAANLKQAILSEAKQCDKPDSPVPPGMYS